MEATDVRDAETATTAALTVFAAALTVSTLVDMAETFSEIRPTSDTRLVCAALTVAAAEAAAEAMDATDVRLPDTATIAALSVSSFATRAAVSTDTACETTLTVETRAAVSTESA